jgi:hypothetical protein
MLKITSIAIGLLTAMTMATNAQALPAEVHHQSFQRPTQTTRTVVVANNRGHAEFKGRHEIKLRRQFLPNRAEFLRRHHRAPVAYRPQYRKFHGHRAHAHSNIRYHY